MVRPEGSWIGPRLLWTGATGARCYDWRAGKEVPARECAENTGKARAIAEASDLILKGDLQEELLEELAR